MANIALRYICQCSLDLTIPTQLCYLVYACFLPQIMLADGINFIANSMTITFLLGYLFALWAALAAWSWFDINARTDNFFYKIGAILIVATGSILGFAIYLLLRPSLTKEEVELREIEQAILTSQSQLLACPSCHFAIKDDFAYCPNCSFKLYADCRECAKPINVSWSACPYCGKEREKPAPVKIVEEKPAEVKPIEIPVEVALASEKKATSGTFFSTIISLLRKRNEKRKEKAKPKTKKAPKKASKAKKAAHSSKKKKT